MRSSRPKVLHEIAGQSMLAHMLAAVGRAGAGAIAVVVGPDRADVAAEARRIVPEAEIFVQAERRGTAHAVLAARAVAKRLGIKTGTAILSIRRVYVTAGDEPVNLTLLLTRTDRYKTSVRLRESAFE